MKETSSEPLSILISGLNALSNFPESTMLAQNELPSWVILLGTRDVLNSNGYLSFNYASHRASLSLHARNAVMTSYTQNEKKR